MTAWTPVHEQVAASNGVEVDVGIVGLLEALWRRGFETEFSCEGGEGGVAHVCFTSHFDAVLFALTMDDTCCRDGRWVFFHATVINDLTNLLTPVSEAS